MRPLSWRFDARQPARIAPRSSLIWFKNSGAETSFYWYVTFMCAIAFVASILMPDPKIKGYLQGEGTEI